GLERDGAEGVDMGAVAAAIAGLGLGRFKEARGPALTAKPLGDEQPLDIEPAPGGEAGEATGKGPGVISEGDHQWAAVCLAGISSVEGGEAVANGRQLVAGRRFGQLEGNS